MNPMQEKLFLELRQTQQEIESSLENKQEKDWFTAILEEELEDVCRALTKLEMGIYGYCEISSDLLPIELLLNIPTIKSARDSQTITSYYRKQI